MAAVADADLERGPELPDPKAEPNVEEYRRGGRDERYGQ